MLKNIRRFIVLCLLSIMLFSTPLAIFAATKDELAEQQADINKKIEETSTELAGVKSQMSNTLKQITRLNTQISDYENEITDLESALKELVTQITVKEEDIKVQEEKFNEQKALFEKRLVALYESGTTTYLDMLLSSDDLSTFISKYYLIGTLAEADDELLTLIENTKKQIEEEKAALEEDKKEIETSKEKISNKKNALSVTVNEKNTLVEDLSDEERLYITLNYNNDTAYTINTNDYPK